MCGRKRGQIGKDDEGDEGADQRNDHRDPAERAVFNPGGRGLSHSRFRGKGLIEAGHVLPSIDASPRRARRAPTAWVMLLYNNVAALRHFRGASRGLVAAAVNLDIQIPNL